MHRVSARVGARRRGARRLRARRPRRAPRRIQTFPRRRAPSSVRCPRPAGPRQPRPGGFHRRLGRRAPSSVRSPRPAGPRQPRPGSFYRRLGRRGLRQRRTGAAGQPWLCARLGQRPRANGDSKPPGGRRPATALLLQPAGAVCSVWSAAPAGRRESSVHACHGCQQHGIADPEPGRHPVGCARQAAAPRRPARSRRASGVPDLLDAASAVRNAGGGRRCLALAQPRLCRVQGHAVAVVRAVFLGAQLGRGPKVCGRGRGRRPAP
mmetsp:Transcript_2585/g.6958  ORF Transcript_2585/g.6958 Transcript_2585/m.6958 type:complete len:265 (+) Transcript_2585:4013-4807(+)